MSFKAKKLAFWMLYSYRDNLQSTSSCEDRELLLAIFPFFCLSLSPFLSSKSMRIYGKESFSLLKVLTIFLERIISFPIDGFQKLNEINYQQHSQQLCYPSGSCCQSLWSGHIAFLVSNAVIF